MSPSKTRKINRRTLVQGSAWAAPVLVATSTIPAYAASTGYQTDDIASVFTGYSIQPTFTAGSTDNGCSTTVLVDTTKYTKAGENGSSPYLAPGFSIGILKAYSDSSLLNKNVNLKSLYYYICVPKNIGSPVLLDGTDANWELDTSYQGNADNFPTENYSGARIFDDPSFQEDSETYGGYNFFRFKYTGNTWSAPLLLDNDTEGNDDNTWPGSPIKVSLTGSAKVVKESQYKEVGACLSSYVLLGSGYVFTADIEGTDEKFTNRTLARKDPATS